MNKTNFFEGVKTLEELKKLYFQLAKQHHPDRGGDLETMQKINNEYDKMLQHFEKYGNRTEQAAARKEAQAPAQFKKIIETLLKKGIDLEIIGSWIWIEKPGIHLNLLKKAGFKWSSKHRKYYLPTEDTSGGRATKYSLERIRSTYGSSILKADEQQQKALA